MIIKTYDDRTFILNDLKDIRVCSERGYYPCIMIDDEVLENYRTLEIANLYCRMIIEFFITGRDTYLLNKYIPNKMPYGNTYNFIHR